MKSEFLALDADGDGDISVAELETLIKSVKRQLKMSDKEISKLIKDVDQNGDGKVDCNEFFHLIQSGKNRDVLHKELIKRSGIRQTFKKYDADGNGVITRDEFRKIVSDKYQTKLMPDQINAMMNKADSDGSGKIDYEEFLKSFTYFPISK